MDGPLVNWERANDVYASWAIVLFLFFYKLFQNLSDLDEIWFVGIEIDWKAEILDEVRVG